MTRPSWHRLVEKRGDQWSVIRYEGPQMRVFVNNYKHEWEANMAADIAEADWAELSEYVKQMKKNLLAKIDAQLDEHAQANDLPRTTEFKSRRDRRPADAYKNAKQLKKQ
jgi:hypothetical protein